MADPVWFYARGDVERGPFTLPQIRALANASKLRPDDLVWKEGMENWTAAREIAELFPSASLVGDQSGSNGLGMSLESRSSTPQAATKTTAAMPSEMRGVFYRIGRALTLLGIVLIVGTSGCESLGARRVSRLTAVAELNASQNAGDVTEEQRTAARAALEYQAAAFTRGVAMQMGLFVVLAGGIGLLLVADRFERWLGLGVILVVVFSALRAFTQ